VCPRANNKITFQVTSQGKFRAADNGDPTSVESFVNPVRSAFNGKCVAIVESTAGNGEMTLVAQSPELGKAEIKIKVSK
jgi:beta-galactosidase